LRQSLPATDVTQGWLQARILEQDWRR